MTQLKTLHAILRSCTDTMGIEFRLYNERVIELSRGGVRHFVYDYDFDLNSASTHLIAKDKGSLSSLFAAHSIPHVEHVSFMRAREGGEHEVENTMAQWADIRKYFLEHGCDVVCKPTFGSEGIGLFHVRNERELEVAVQRLAMLSPSITLSPFVSIAHEYRCILLKNQCLLIYEKIRPCIVGDGESSVLELVTRQALQVSTNARALATIVHSLEIPLDTVLPPQEKLILEWKHNLVHGAGVAVLPQSKESESLSALALSAARAINVQFGAIDIVAEEGMPLRVLEINAGVKMEAFVHRAPHGYEQVRAIYARALEVLFPDA